MTITINGTTGITTPEVTLDNSTADGGQVVLKSSGYSNWNLDNYSGRFRGYYGSTEYFTVDSSGNMGIGTSSPNAKLYVASAATQAIVVGQGTIGTDYGIGRDNSNGALTFYGNQTGAVSYIFSGVNGERARIDTSGNLLVGTTASSLPSQGLNLITGSGSYYAAGHASGTSSGTGYAFFLYNSGIIGSITQNGTTGVLYNLTSDYRLKNDPQPLTGAKEFVMALQPKKWQWWDGSGEGVGFIAHEFMEVAKYSGHGEKDAVDENGNIIPQSIQPSSSEVMANLVSLIQEQQAQITQLQADVAALKGQQA